jgi:hypothetical protein
VFIPSIQPSVEEWRAFFWERRATLRPSSGELRLYPCTAQLICGLWSILLRNRGVGDLDLWSQELVTLFTNFFGSEQIPPILTAMTDGMLLPECSVLWYGPTNQMLTDQNRDTYYDERKGDSTVDRKSRFHQLSTDSFDSELELPMAYVLFNYPRGVFHHGDQIILNVKPPISWVEEWECLLVRILDILKEAAASTDSAGRNGNTNTNRSNHAFETLVRFRNSVLYIPPPSGMLGSLMHHKACITSTFEQRLAAELTCLEGMNADLEEAQVTMLGLRDLPPVDGADDSLRWQIELCKGEIGYWTTIQDWWRREMVESGLLEKLELAGEKEEKKSKSEA